MPSVTKPARATAGRAAVQERLASATLELLATGTSFTELSVGAIADTARIARSTFYVHFPDKASLLIYLAGSAAEDLFAVADEWWKTDAPNGAEQFTEMIAHLLESLRARGLVLAAVVETMSYDKQVEAFWNDRVAALATLIQSRVEYLADAGILGRADRVDRLAEIAAWSIERNVTRHVLTAPASEDAAFSEVMARALWQMVFSGPAA